MINRKNRRPKQQVCAPAARLLLGGRAPANAPISDIVGRFKGEIGIWDVANEVTDFDRESTRKGGPTVTAAIRQMAVQNYLRTAFARARQANPHAVLKGVWGKIPSGALEFPATERLAGVFTQQEAASRRPRLTGISAKLKICQRKINELQAGKTL